MPAATFFIPDKTLSESYRTAKKHYKDNRSAMATDAFTKLNALFKKRSSRKKKP